MEKSNSSDTPNARLKLDTDGGEVAGPPWLVLVAIGAVLLIVLSLIFYKPARDALVCVLTEARANCLTNENQSTGGDVPVTSNKAKRSHNPLTTISEEEKAAQSVMRDFLKGNNSEAEQ